MLRPRNKETESDVLVLILLLCISLVNELYCFVRRKIFLTDMFDRFFFLPELQIELYFLI